MWRGTPVPFLEGQTIASALLRAGVPLSGADDLGPRFFCGIGSCQNCLVRFDGRIVEACLTPATTGSRLAPLGD
jgi:formate dehydrogenase major subunit